MICASDSTEHGPAITTNSSPPITVPFTRTRVFPARNCLLTNLYGAEMRTTFSTCGMDSSDSHHANYHALLPFDRVHFVAEMCNLVAHFIDLLPRGVHLHRNNHGFFLS